MGKSSGSHCRLRGEVMISEHQYGFMLGRSTTDVVFAFGWRSIDKVRRSCIVSLWI